MTRLTVLLATFLAVLLLPACSRKARPAPAPSATPAGAPVAAGPTAGADESARIAEEEARRRAERARAYETLTGMVYFDFDSYTLREESRDLLGAKVPILQADPAIRLRLEGHTDERGSEEYNVALGMRRAQAAREFLAGFGIPEARLDVISFGEARPHDPGEGEAAWSRNRRVEFQVAAGLAEGR